MDNRKTCIGYDFKLIHLIIPPQHILFKICLIRDKTKLFVITLLRIIIHLILLFIFYKNKNSIFFYLFIILILSQLLIILKKPLFSDMELNNLIETRLDFITKNGISSSLENRSLGRTETEKIFMPDILEVPGRIKSIS